MALLIAGAVDVRGFGSAGEAPVVGDVEEVAKVGEVHEIYVSIVTNNMNTIR